MLKENIPFFSNLSKSLKTRKEILAGNKLYELEDWQVIKEGFLPAKDMAVRLSILAFIPAWLASAFFGSVNISDKFLKEFYSLKEILDNFTLPFLIYLSVYFGAKYIFKKERRSSSNIVYAQRLFTYEFYSKLLWPMVILNILVLIIPSLLSGYTIFGRFLRDLPEMFSISFLVIFSISFLAIFLWSLYLQYYVVPKKLLSEKEINYDFHYLFSFGIKYWLSTAFALILLKLLILFISLIFSGIKVLASDLSRSISFGLGY